MSDMNDDLLNYEIGDIDDHELVNEDELLLSDDETSPTKLSQQEEALLLGDEEHTNFHSAKLIKDTKTVPEPIDQTDDNVSTTTTESVKEQVDSTSASVERVNPLPEKPPQKINRTALKRNSITVIVATTETVCTEAQSESKKFRVDAPEFHPQEPVVISESNIVEESTIEESVVESTNVVVTTIESITENISTTKDNTEELSAVTEATENEIIIIDDVSENGISTEPNQLCENDTTQGLSQNSSIVVDTLAKYTSEETDSDYSQQCSTAIPEFETEDSDRDEDNERLNPKTRVERGVETDGYNNAAPQPLFKKTGIRGGRGGPAGAGTFLLGPRPGVRYPNPYNPFSQHPGNENFNPQFHFRPQMERPPSLLMTPNCGPRGGHPQPMPSQYRTHLLPQPHNFRSPFLNDLNRPRLGGMPIQQMPLHPVGGGGGGGGGGLRLHGPPRLDFQPNSVPPFRSFNGNPAMRPGGNTSQQIMPQRFEQHVRPRMPPNQQFMQPRMPQQQAQHQQQQQQFGGPPHAGNLLVQAPTRITGQPNSGSVIPRKVLINPNFKGGVEAATNQLMMDTLNNPQYITANNDAELLRQQEAFINQNRMHIEKRRNERSPERERSYSPPRRDRRPYSRERDVRKPPYNSYNRGGGNGGPGGHDSGRGKRAGSREGYYSKRRRSNSTERDDRKDQKIDKEPEDEETRAYRLEIEKQKSMREKILKDKEIRRRQAAEGKTDDNKKATEEPTNIANATQKLTPIIVTEKKIISLKKKGEQQAVIVPAHRSIPTAKVLPESKKNPDVLLQTLAIVKPVQKFNSRTVANADDIHATDDYDEDELLADSPSTSPIPQSSGQLLVPASTATAAGAAHSGTNKSSGIGRFSNRRVVLKTSHATDTRGSHSQQSQNVAISTSTSNKLGLDKNESSGGGGAGKTTSSSNKSKGIFDRLDRKVNVAESSKRKIKRIIINNAD